MSDTRLVTVCDKCFRSSCWQGIFPCDEAQTTAGLTEKTVDELRALNVEHESYYLPYARRNPTSVEYDDAPFGVPGIKSFGGARWGDE